MREATVYFFKNDAYGDEWQERKSHAFDVYCLAEEVAEEYYTDEPGDPNRFEFDIEVKKGVYGTPVHIRVTAEATVNFHSRDLNE